MLFQTVAFASFLGLVKCRKEERNFGITGVSYLFVADTLGRWVCMKGKRGYLGGALGKHCLIY